MNIGFLASHNGSNFQAIFDACKSGALEATPAVVISNNSESGAIERAKKEKIPHYHISSITHPEPRLLDHAILKIMLDHAAELIILAGYMKKIGPQTLSNYSGRILDVHPALLPKFGGKGMYGMNVHKAVIEAKELETGATIHVVDEEYDSGAIIAQSKVKVELTDTPETIAAKVLQIEHQLFPETLQKIVDGDILFPITEN
jgi:phosphoribosylglycinamide formyltransferase-1